MNKIPKIYFFQKSNQTIWIEIKNTNWNYFPIIGKIETRNRFGISGSKKGVWNFMTTSSLQKIQNAPPPHPHPRQPILLSTAM